MRTAFCVELITGNYILDEVTLCISLCTEHLQRHLSANLPPHLMYTVGPRIFKSGSNKARKPDIFYIWDHSRADMHGSWMWFWNLLTPRCSLHHLLHFLSLFISPSLLFLASHYNGAFADEMVLMQWFYLTRNIHARSGWHARVDLRIKTDL